jgi:hypothetical protein
MNEWAMSSIVGVDRRSFPLYRTAVLRPSLLQGLPRNLDEEHMSQL